jgi:hypothetical protein
MAVGPNESISSVKTGALARASTSLLILLVGCAGSGPEFDRSKPFEILFYWGVEGRNRLDSISGTLTKDMVTGPPGESNRRPAQARRRGADACRVLDILRPDSLRRVRPCACLEQVDREARDCTGGIHAVAQAAWRVSVARRDSPPRCPRGWTATCPRPCRGRSTRSCAPGPGSRRAGSAACRCHRPSRRPCAGDAG